MSTIHEQLGINPSAESLDYLSTKSQFQLHSLLTEQRHPSTMNLSYDMQSNPIKGIQSLITVDNDIENKIKDMISDDNVLNQLESLVNKIHQCIRNNKHIYVYGCGATGRLAKQMESNFWRPFWRDLSTNNTVLYNKITSSHENNNILIEDLLIGEMTGADRALISSLEGFEDLLLIGEKQLQQHNIERGDCIICVTEGGETSSVIGTILAGLEQYNNDDDNDDDNDNDPKNSLYFIYNNPDTVLLPFKRSASVINNNNITKINLTTGPQSITGSTRMQATSSETFIVACLVHIAIHRYLLSILTPDECSELGFSAEIESVKTILFDWFHSLYSSYANESESITEGVLLESNIYSNNGKTTYYADKALITVFIDCTERSPTFRLFPIDTVDNKERKCLVRVWTAANDREAAWNHFLMRPFCGMPKDFYFDDFNNKISDLYLKKAALSSLERAGNDESKHYDFSFPKECNEYEYEELAVALMLEDELDSLKDSESYWRLYCKLFYHKDIYFIILSQYEKTYIERMFVEYVPEWSNQQQSNKKRLLTCIQIDHKNDPLRIKQQIALKMVLNTHSTAVMAKLGKVVGNTMTNVSPSNLKLIGRATYLILSHVQDSLKLIYNNDNKKNNIDYNICNNVLFHSIDYVKENNTEFIGGGAPEVAISIIMIIEACIRNEHVNAKSAYDILVSKEIGSLQKYFEELHNRKTSHL